MHNLDDMMILWKEMDSKLSSLVEENRKLAEEIKKNKLRSSQEKLTRKYWAFIIMEAFCIPMMIFIIGMNPYVVDSYRWPAVIFFICFILFEISIDCYLLYKLNAIDIYNDSIVEISRQARTNWKIHKLAVLIGIPLAIGSIALFCAALGCNAPTLWGIFVGVIIGLAIGLNQFFKFKKNYKSMI